MALAQGTRLGRYEIRGLLGAGGMGEVYRARDHELDRDVAVKVLRDTGLQSPSLVQRFLQEAKTASGLHHPNVGHVYDIGSQDAFRFIAMEIIEGETLRQRMHRGTMPVDEALDIATQIASALAAAHRAGIIHRDIKPENVMLTPEGYAKVLDFGLAKLRDTTADGATAVMTRPGVAMGTLSYMAPEQLVGGEVTPAADVFSLGLVIYEMLAGRKAFDGATSADLVSAILTKSPRPLSDIRPEIPPKLETVVVKALAKDPSERYPDAGALLDQLRDVSREMVEAKAPAEPWRGARLLLIALAVLVFAGAAVIAIRARTRANERRAAIEKLDKAETLLKQKRFADAYAMAASTLPVLAGDVRLRDIIARTSDDLEVDTDPPGATVWLQRYKGPTQRVRIGVTPLHAREVGRADYIFTLEKPGYATATGTLSMVPVYNTGEPRFQETPPLRRRLVESAKQPPDMVLVPGGTYRLSSYSRPSDRPVQLSDFFIDRTEVTNRDFDQFVRAGGYRRPELWTHPFVDGGKTLSFDQAMARLRDTTGVAGPRGWSGGAPPAGMESHPVTGVTWYEAAAFAEWKGKKLPSIYQWERAARGLSSVRVRTVLPWGVVGEGVDATERSNFLGQGTMPADSMPFGASPWGALHMAGNVSEWCRNAMPPGFTARGGSYRDNVYAFGQTAAYPGFYSAPTVGFRCVTGGTGDEGDFALSADAPVPEYKPVDDATFARFAKRYEYAPAPLQARIVETVETPDWRREKITYVVAGKTVPAYLWLPKGVRPPYQAIQLAPAGDVVQGWRTLSHSIEIQFAPLIRAGRAIFSVELEGFLGRPRPADWAPPNGTDEEYVDTMVADVTEMRRGLDYLETRNDIDRSRIAFLAVSAGGGPGVLVTALESRYRTVIFQGSGIGIDEKPFAPVANRINFVPRIRGPKLMLQGRFDEDTPMKTESEPMYRLLPEPKRMVLYDGPHIPPPEIGVPTFQKWLDETMGPVK